MKHRLTRAADADIEHVLRETLRLFGPNQVRRYASHIAEAIRLAAENPVRPGCVERADIRPGLRSIHIEIAARKRNAAAHVLYFSEMTTEKGDPEIVILRLLHEKMEPKRRLIHALRDTSINEDK